MQKFPYMIIRFSEIHPMQYIHMLQLPIQLTNLKFQLQSREQMINKNDTPQPELKDTRRNTPSTENENIIETPQSHQFTPEKILQKLQSTIHLVKDKYDEYKRNKQQRLTAFPTPKVYPSKPHLMQPQTLRKFNFSQLSKEQTQMLDDLSTFTPHRQFVKMMTNKYTDMKKKEHFIKQHSAILSSDQFSDFNRAKFDYQSNSRTFAAFCTGFLTLGGFMIGLYVLPARKSPWKYSLIGLGLGLGVSYGFWRVQIFRYHDKMNQQFKSIMRDKYENEKRTQRSRQQKSQQ